MTRGKTMVAVALSGLTGFALWHLGHGIGARLHHRADTTVADVTDEAPAQRTRPPRFVVGAPAPTLAPTDAETRRVFAHPFWRAVGPKGQQPAIDGLLALAKDLQISEPHRQMLTGIFPTLAEAAHQALDAHDGDVARMVQEEAERVLVALADDDEQTTRIEKFFSPSNGE